MFFVTNDKEMVTRWKQAVGDTPYQLLESFDALTKIAPSVKDELVIFDLNIPDLQAVASAVHFCKETTAMRMVFMTAEPDESEGLKLITAGARGYCNRYMDPALLEKAIDVVKLGEVWLGRTLMTRLMANLSALTRQIGTGREDPKLAALTKREKEIALLVGEGETNKNIALKLNIAERTVKAHLGSVFSKTETKDRLQLGLLVNISRH